MSEPPLPSRAEILALAEAMGDMLGDMGADGQCVCPHAKAKGRLTYEPFIALMEDDSPSLMALDEARRIVREAEY